MNRYIDKIIKAKENISIFKNMEDKDIKSILQNVMFMHFEPNEAIIQQGECSKEVYLLIEGECEVVYKDEVVAIIHENEPFGEFAPITHERRKATVRAKTPVKVIVFRLNMVLLENALDGYAILYRNFVEELIKKLEMSNNR